MPASYARLRADLVVSRQETAGGVVFVLKDPEVGRFLRFNSWDPIFKPVELYHGIGRWASNPLANSSSWVFPVLFATFLFIAYVMLYGLTHLQPAVPMQLPQRS